jgi:hypothetical protein
MNIEWDELFETLSLEDGGVKKIITGISVEESMLFDLDNPLVYVMNFRKCKQLYSKSIALVTKSIYTHTALTFRDDMHFYYEMIVKKGLLESSVRNFHQDRIIDVMTYPVNIEEKKRLFKLVKFFLNNKKINYDNKTVLKILFKILKYKENPISTLSVTDKDQFICSAFVANLLAVVDPDLRKYVNKNKINIDAITPKEIVTLPKLKYAFSYNGETGKREYLEDIAKTTKK